jgi:hypothetical protein
MELLGELFFRRNCGEVRAGDSRKPNRLLKNR